MSHSIGELAGVAGVAATRSRVVGFAFAASLVALVPIAVAASPKSVPFVRDESRMFSSEAVVEAEARLANAYRTSGRAIVVHTVDDVAPKSSLSADAARDYKLLPPGSVELYVVQSSRSEQVLTDGSRSPRGDVRVVSAVFDRDMTAGDADLALHDAVGAAISSFIAGDSSASVTASTTVPSQLTPHVAPSDRVTAAPSLLSRSITVDASGSTPFNSLSLSLLGLVVAIAAIGLYGLSRKRAAGPDASRWGRDLKSIEMPRGKAGSVVPSSPTALSFDSSGTSDLRATSLREESVVAPSSSLYDHDVLDSSNAVQRESSFDLSASPVRPESETKQSKPSKGGFWNRSRPKTETEPSSVDVVSDPFSIVPLLATGAVAGASVAEIVHESHPSDIDVSTDTPGESDDSMHDAPTDMMLERADDGGFGTSSVFESSVDHEHDIDVYHDSSESFVEPLTSGSDFIHSSDASSLFDDTENSVISVEPVASSDTLVDVESHANDPLVAHPLTEASSDFSSVSDSLEVAHGLDDHSSLLDTSHDSFGVVSEPSFFDDTVDASPLFVAETLPDATETFAHATDSVSDASDSVAVIEPSSSESTDLVDVGPMSLEDGLAEDGVAEHQPLDSAMSPDENLSALVAETSTHEMPSDIVDGEIVHPLVLDETSTVHSDDVQVDESSSSVADESLSGSLDIVHGSSSEVSGSVSSSTDALHPLTVEPEAALDALSSSEISDESRRDSHDESGEAVAEIPLVSDVSDTSSAPSAEVEDFGDIEVDDGKALRSEELNAFVGFDRSEFEALPIEFDDGRPSMVARGESSDDDDDLLKGVDLGRLNWDDVEESMKAERELARRREELASLPAPNLIVFDDEVPSLDPTPAAPYEVHSDHPDSAMPSDP